MTPTATLEKPLQDRSSNPQKAIYGGQKVGDRLDKLLAREPELRERMPSAEINLAKAQPEVRLSQAIQMVMEGYADRPALGHRARELVKDRATGRNIFRLMSHFETITYRELWTRIRATATEWHHHSQQPLKAGNFVCILGFASPDYGTVMLANYTLGGVNVPLQTSAPPANHRDIMVETEPRILASSINYLDAAIDALLLGYQPPRLQVFDYDPREDDQRDRLANARARLAKAGSTTVIETLDEIIARGKTQPQAPLYVPEADEDPLAALFYTSGSTGTPKGAMISERLAITTWQNEFPMPVITLSFMPMSHLIGTGYMTMALANGGTSYCAPRADLSTLFEDFSLVRPTTSSLVPRVCELLHHHYMAELDRRIAAGASSGAVDEAVKCEIREQLLGGRLMSVGCGSASLSPETHRFMEAMLAMHLPIGYSSTEIAGGTVMVDWKIQRPMVLDYKLADVPDLGYFTTDKPHPRGELCVKTQRFMKGYYKRPELLAEKVDKDGFYHTGDIMAELGPDNLIYLDRVNNVTKLSQGEFVAISRLEALYMHHPAIRQIYLYGNAARAFLLAVVVPVPELAAQAGPNGKDADHVRGAIRRGLQEIAEREGLATYEVPRDFVIEPEPFSQRNGLLTEVGKHQRPKLKERYAPVLDQMYVDIEAEQLVERRALMADSAHRPVVETVTRAVQAILGLSAVDLPPDAKFTELGGDSLSALSFSLLLGEIFAIEVPVGVIIGPTGDIRRIARYIDTERTSGGKRPTFAGVHGADVTVAKAADLSLEKFIPQKVLDHATALPKAVDTVNTVLITGATGFLGRFQAVAWLERLSKTGGRVICIARGSDAAEARKRIDTALGSDPVLIGHLRSFGKHLEVIAGDIGLPNLGVDDDTWARLAGTVDVVVHPAAHVNHVLPYNQLFAANVAGTAELIRLALTTRMKRFHYVSTLGVMKFSDRPCDEDGDIRKTMPAPKIDTGYANGYGLSKWASEVLLRGAYDLCRLPVSIFRPGMILAHSRYVGQLNVPDMFTRLLYSLAVTGVAPATFYAKDLSKGRPHATYAGLSVDYLAEVITAIGENDHEGFRTYNLSSPHDDGVSLDSFVDWMIEAGCDIKRIDNYDEWRARFETAMHALSEEQQQQSMLAILGPYDAPQSAGSGPSVPAARFRAASKAAGLAIPNITAELIKKYVADLRSLRLLRTV